MEHGLRVRQTRAPVHGTGAYGAVPVFVCVPRARARAARPSLFAAGVESFAAGFISGSTRAVPYAVLRAVAHHRVARGVDGRHHARRACAGCYRVCRGAPAADRLAGACGLKHGRGADRAERRSGSRRILVNRRFTDRAFACHFARLGSFESIAGAPALRAAGYGMGSTPGHGHACRLGAAQGRGSARAGHSRGCLGLARGQRPVVYRGYQRAVELGHAACACLARRGVSQY